MPVHDDRRLFEMLILEGAQAGLSLDRRSCEKRENYRKAFSGFDPAKVARFDARKIERLFDRTRGSSATGSRSTPPFAMPGRS